MIPTKLITQFNKKNILNSIPNKTYCLDVQRGKISGYVDDIQAMEQAIYKILNTERFEYNIYSHQYGVELDELIGGDPFYAMGDLERRISEALLQDNRITSIVNFSIMSPLDDELHMSFTVVTTVGEIHIEREVKISDV